MKAETRAGYIGRISKALRTVQGLVEGATDQGDVNRFLRLFQEGREVQDYVMEVEDSGKVSNKLQSYEGKVATACGEESPMADELPVEMEEGSAGQELIGMLNQAQELLHMAYERAVSVNSLARSVQEIKDIQTAAIGLTSVIHGVSRLGGLEAVNNPVGHNKKGQGLVVSIRVNPGDCQTVLALLDKSGIQRSNQTFSSLVSLCLSGMLEAARIDGTVREPDPFQYWNDMEQYHKSSREKQKESVVSTIAGHATGLCTPLSRTIPTSSSHITDTVQDAAVRAPEEPDASQEAGRRLQELIDNGDCESEAFHQLYAEVYPDG